jgi:hypothetical protein
MNAISNVGASVISIPQDPPALPKKTRQEKQPYLVFKMRDVIISSVTPTADSKSVETVNLLLDSGKLTLRG